MVDLFELIFYWRPPWDWEICSFVADWSCGRFKAPCYDKYDAWNHDGLMVLNEYTGLHGWLSCSWREDARKNRDLSLIRVPCQNWLRSLLTWPSFRASQMLRIVHVSEDWNKKNLFRRRASSWPWRSQDFIHDHSNFKSTASIFLGACGILWSRCRNCIPQEEMKVHSLHWMIRSSINFRTFSAGSRCCFVRPCHELWIRRWYTFWRVRWKFLFQYTNHRCSSL